MTTEELQAEADAGGFPGPSTKQHSEDNDGPCLCGECLSYGDD